MKIIKCKSRSQRSRWEEYLGLVHNWDFDQSQLSVLRFRPITAQYSYSATNCEGFGLTEGFLSFSASWSLAQAGPRALAKWSSTEIERTVNIVFNYSRNVSKTFCGRSLKMNCIDIFKEFQEFRIEANFFLHNLPVYPVMSRSSLNAFTGSTSISDSFFFSDSLNTLL